MKFSEPMLNEISASDRDRNLDSRSTSVGKRSYAGLFLVSLATLMYEIVLTRIFSVTLRYDFAFFAVSVAMLGLAAGAVLVHILNDRIGGNFDRVLAWGSFLFCLSIVASLLIHMSIPWMMRRTFAGLASIALNLAAISVPFVLSGFVRCLMISRFSDSVGRLYAADLGGAAAGCILWAGLLAVTDGPTAVMAIAGIAAFGAWFFASWAGSAKLKGLAVAALVFLMSFTVVNAVLAYRQSPRLRLTWVRGQREARPLYEKWNSFSRIQVVPGPKAGWGEHLNILIDAFALTPMRSFKGDLRAIDNQRRGITSLAHYLRPDADVLIVGSGGGLDVLTALLFKQRSVLAVEVNKTILDVVNKRYGDYTGHLDRYANVSFVNDEARSFIERSRDRFDIIHIPFVDTFAATGGGAFFLTEHSLYTVEAWKSFLEHLGNRGVLSVSRDYHTRVPAVMYRLVALASAALTELGIRNPRRHLLMVKAKTPDISGFATLIVARAPLAEEDLKAAEKAAGRHEWEVVLSPRSEAESVLGSLAAGHDPGSVLPDLAINLNPPTDDNPFFFNMLRFRDLGKRKLTEGFLVVQNMKAVRILGWTLLMTAGLTVFYAALPLASAKGAMWKQALPRVIYFSGIGFGFMLIEVSQIQRMTLFLGHPSYSLSVVLFSLLVAGGLGSLATHRMDLLTGRGVLLLLLLGASAFGLMSPAWLNFLQGFPTLYRILGSMAMIFPLGFLMGMPFPFGIRDAGSGAASLTPWLWGINGAASVCGAVLSVAMAIEWGISSAFWAGTVSYGIALAAFGFRMRDPVT